MNSSWTTRAVLAFAAATAMSVAAAEFATAPEAPFTMPAISIWQIPEREFSIADFGAEPGGKTKCTEAFRKAIAACEKAGGGRVAVPRGEWLTGAIHLKSNVALDLHEGATVVFTDDPADYLPPVPTTWEGVELVNYSPLVYAHCCTNVAIVGRGTLAPKMDLWRKWFSRPPAHMAFTAALYEWCSKVVPIAERNALAMAGSNARPHLIQFNRSANILLEGFSIRESPFWTIHLYHSENAVLRNLDVYAHGHNNDGVDVEMTRNVIIERCSFDQGDDAVVLKAGRNQDAWALARPTENVVVRDCKVRDGHVLLGVGSELSGGVRNIYMHDCHMKGDIRNVFYVKTNERRGGTVENIYMKDCTAESRGKKPPEGVVNIQTDVLYQWRKLPTYEVRPTKIRNLVAENVSCDTARYLLYVCGDAREPVDGVRLKNVTCATTLAERPVDVMNARGVFIDGAAVDSRSGKAPSH